MNKFLQTLGFLLLCTAAFCQSPPQGFKYQAVVRDASGGIIADQNIGMQVMILKGAADGSTVYTETHSPTSNTFGLVGVTIGRGMNGTPAFEDIDWSMGPFFIKIEIDKDGGTMYTLSSTEELLSVPFALHSDDADSDPMNEIELPTGGTDGQVLSTDGADNYSWVDDTDADPLNEIELPINPQDGTIAFYNSGAWQVLTPGTDGQVLTLSGGLPIWADPEAPLKIGDIHAGGIIFYLAGPNEDLNGDGIPDQGLVAALADQSTGAQWGCSGTDIPGLPNVPFNGGNPAGPGAEVGDGASNTTLIVNNCATAGIAARICDDLNLSGFSDWFLPSAGELDLMYTNLHLNALGGFASNLYWSSTEDDFNYDAWFQFFFDGNQDFIVKLNFFNVRAVRAF